MALMLEDKWIWDFWLVESDGVHHMFYLQAPRSLGDPGLRHWNVSIGHATSTDLIEWSVLEDALAPGPSGAWDDKSTWTGSIIRHDDAWYLLYTGTSSRDEGLRQRIGLAVSDDLMSWQRVGDQPVITADPTWYETLESGEWHDEAWRDPWVFRHPDGLFHTTITARSNQGPRYGRGVVGHAVSADLMDWEVRPPIAEPDGFGQAEVSQVIEHRGRWYLIFCSDLHTQGPERRASGPGSGTYFVKSDTPLGPYLLRDALPLDVDRRGSSYAGRIVDRGDGDLALLSWDWIDGEHRFVGAIGDPVPVVATEDGDLQLSPPS